MYPVGRIAHTAYCIVQWLYLRGIHQQRTQPLKEAQPHGTMKSEEVVTMRSAPFYYILLVICLALAGILSAVPAIALAECESPAEPTPAMTEGPYYKSGTPRRTSLLTPDMEGQRIVITGQVLSTDCRPLDNARLDFWQTDARGRYDHDGYRLRGHQFTDENGQYRLETVVPGTYSGRTEHIHVKVTPPGGSVLTTQLFFPGAQGNERDWIFDSRLLLDLQQNEGRIKGEFDFIVPGKK